MGEGREKNERKDHGTPESERDVKAGEERSRNRHGGKDGCPFATFPEEGVWVGEGIKQQ